METDFLDKELKKTEINDGDVFMGTDKTFFQDEFFKITPIVGENKFPGSLSQIVYSYSIVSK
jgi:hypothetical protein